MLFRPSDEDPLNEADNRLRLASTCNSDLFSTVLKVCPQLAARDSVPLKRLHQLLEMGAYTDAALTLIEAEIPAWQLRRLIFDAGEWHCTLSRNPSAPVEFDDMTEAHHECLPLAILGAIVEACRSHPMRNASSETAVPQAQCRQYFAVCCDNFSL
jgi:hypothetical protein